MKNDSDVEKGKETVGSLVYLDPPQAVPVRTENFSKELNAIRFYGHILFVTSWFSMITPGIVFGPPVDLVLIIALYVLIILSTKDQQDLVGEQPYQCCGFRSIFGLSVACMVFHIIFSTIRTGTCFTLGGFDLEQYNHYIKVASILQAIATTATGIDIYLLWAVISLSSPLQQIQCFTSSRVVTDPREFQSERNELCICRRFGAIMIALSTLATILIVTLLAPYSDCSNPRFENSKSCCIPSNGLEITCLRASLTDNFLLPQQNASSSCACQQDHPCPAQFTVFFPILGKNTTELLEMMRLKNDLKRIPTCQLESAQASTKCDLTLKDPSYYLYYASSACDLSRYTCSEAIPKEGVVCPDAFDKLYISQ